MIGGSEGVARYSTPSVQAEEASAAAGARSEGLADKIDWLESGEMTESAMEIIAVSAENADARLGRVTEGTPSRGEAVSCRRGDCTEAGGVAAVAKGEKVPCVLLVPPKGPSKSS